MIDREYGKPDFPIVSDPFDDPKSPPTLSTELENTDTFGVDDIFDLGFLRSNPQREIYKHKDKLDIYLQVFYEQSYSVKDRVVRRIVIYQDVSLPLFSKVIYNSTKPSKEDIKKILW